MDKIVPNFVLVEQNQHLGGIIPKEKKVKDTVNSQSGT